MRKSEIRTIGVISDTHGLLRPEAVDAMRGSDAIIHAGDVGERSILEQLARVAPVTVVRGNIDTDSWGRELPETDVLEVSSLSIYILHDVKQLDLDPRAAGFAAVISGHSHQPRIEWRDGVLFFNPGSSGPRRFSLPISVGKIVIADRQLKPELIELEL